MDKQNSKHKNNTEQLILEAAVKEFSTKGFDGARTARIAAEAGVTHAMLHYYFRTKELLFYRIFEEKIRDVLHILFATIVQTKGGIKERIRRVVETHFDIIMQNEWLPAFLITTFNSNPELYDVFIKEIKESSGLRFEAIQVELDKAYEAGEIVKVDHAMLLGDIASLNIFSFLAAPLMMTVAGYKPGEEDAFYAARRKENVEIILKRIS